MAYYAEAGFGEYYTTPSSYAYAPPTYDIVPFQDSVSYSNDGFTEPEFDEHYPASYSSSAYYDPFPSHLEINHSMYRASEPLLIEYNPISYRANDGFSEPEFSEHYPASYSSSAYYDPFLSHSEYRASEPLLIEYNPISSYSNQFSSDTQYFISYSTATAELDDTHYEEYDPTPYDGGYDPTLTYGKPLSPSTEICHPRTSPVSGNSISPDKVDYRSIPSPYGVDDDVKELPAKPSNVAEPIKSNEEQKLEPMPEPEPDGDSDSEDEAEISIQPENEPDSRAGYGYGVGVTEQATRVPYGCGLESMDLCETLFGYWPCWEKQKRMSNGVGSEEDDQQRQWRCAADYLFGRSPSGYGGGFEGGNNYWEPTCNYERHYQRENHIQVVNSWLLNSSTVYSSESPSSSYW